MRVDRNEGGACNDNPEASVGRIARDIPISDNGRGVPQSTKKEYVSRGRGIRGRGRRGGRARGSVKMIWEGNPLSSDVGLVDVEVEAVVNGFQSKGSETTNSAALKPNSSSFLLSSSTRTTTNRSSINLCWQTTPSTLLLQSYFYNRDLNCSMDDLNCSMDRSSSLMLANKKRKQTLSPPPPPLRKQPMRSCRLRATEVNQVCSSLLAVLNKKNLTSSLVNDEEDLSLPAALFWLNAGQVKSGVNPTSACPDESIQSKIISLPQELVFNILVLLPADVLHNVMRYLCFQWCKIICNPVFRKAHLLRSSASGLFIQYEFGSRNAYYVDTGTRDVTVTRINFQNSCKVWATCDGLVLFSYPYDRNNIYIANPITKQQVTLPPFKWSWFGSCFTLACARSTGEYKVVGTYKENQVFCCGIITVGKDLTWGTVDTRNICMDKRIFLKHRPHSTGGYVYWASQAWSSLLILDVETEVLLEFLAPKSSSQGWQIWYKEMGNFLGCMFLSFNALLVFEVLVLADPKTGEWKNLYKFDLNGKREFIRLSLYKEFYRATVLELQPIAWVNNGEVLVFTTFDPASTSYIAHNVKTGETYSFSMCEENDTPFWCPHVNSLVSLDLPQ
ncbi:hypothetical protein RHGRI_021371 [Rhododendron griersonianum]|uniref:F-box associated beta-propeller type 3 domain-containing protein n=1 Tax=Rhododendron griersonianum TaxID=479676 RepID=A0AAV6JJZ7_9ERIC|nr:hypothetical protein RHGRI_021371 [Rhododendron griersonianum]